jgi:phosphatidylglycerol:prolipoprotein diacylglycerol transferase
MIPYPEIDPVAVAIGPLKVRWYGLMYLVGFGIGWFLARSRARRPEFGWKVEWVDDLIFYAALGLILGARIGYMLFYGYDTWSQNPLAILKIWEGGMSFHGGLLGLILCVWLYGRYGKYGSREETHRQGLLRSDRLRRTAGAAGPDVWQARQLHQRRAVG